MSYWGKRQDLPDHSETHPLSHHVLEVAIVTLELLNLDIFRRRLSQALGLPDLSPHQRQRLAVLAALHDVGKCNHGFQDGRESRQWQTHGHVREIFKLLFDSPRSEEGFSALALAEITSWFTEATGTAIQDSPDPLIGWLWTVFCHHGRPLPGDPNSPGRPGELHKISKRVWDAGPERDPVQGLSELVHAIRRIFAGAFTAECDPLPITPAAQHLFNGLVTLADWIASDAKRFFPFSSDANLPSLEILTQKARTAVQKLGLDPHQARQDLRTRATDFARVFGLAAPNAMQHAVAQLPDPHIEQVVILEAETGSGKTEAALWHFLKLFEHGHVDGLYFALPTRAAAVQIHGRTLEAMRQAFGPDHPAVILAVPGYLRVDQEEGIPLAPFTTLWNDETSPLQYRGWAAEHPKRYLAAPIAVGTIDQVLLSALSTSHAHMRAAALSRLLLVVDEVHASDPFMTTILREVLQRLRQVGGYALLMSATLGSVARSMFLSDHSRPFPPASRESSQHPYPLLTRRHGTEAITETAIAPQGPGKRVTIEFLPWADLASDVAALALKAAETGARVLVIRNTVSWAVNTQLALEEEAGKDSQLLWRCQGVSAAHHARFAAEDRRSLDQAIALVLGKGTLSRTGQVVVSTQTVEQSLDIDVDYLISDLCPMDVLLQRIGRLHRHERTDRPAAFATPRVVLLEPEGGLEAGLTEKGECSRGFMQHGWGSVYPDLRVLQATAETLHTLPCISLPKDNRRLVEAATHPENLEALATRLGERWKKHADTLWGTRTSQIQQARSSLYDRDRWLHNCDFYGHADRRLTTRLGMDDRLVRFPDPSPMGPFQKQISALTIPGRWLLANFPADVSPKNVVEEIWGFSFTMDTHRFHYDRLGLRPSPLTDSGGKA